MQKKQIIILSSIGFAVVLAYLVYNFFIVSQLNQKLESMTTEAASYSASETEKENMAQVEELIGQYPEFFNGKGMTPEELANTQTGVETLMKFDKQTELRTEEIQQELDGITRFSASSFNNIKEDVFEQHHLRVNKERDQVERFDEFRLEQFQIAQEFCKDEITFGEIFNGTLEGDQDNLTFMLLNAQEYLCPKLK